MEVGADTLRKATFVVAGLVVATGIPTLILSFDTGGPAGPGITATSHRHDAPRPVTAAGSSETSSATPTTSTTTTSTNPDVPSVGATAGVTTSTAPTTTIAPPAPPCQWSQFTVTVATQRPSYAQGQAIPFTVTVDNTGPACTDQGQAHCDCWSAYAESSSGQTVWVWGAPNPPTSSDSVTSPPPVLPAGWSTSRSMSWDQNQCTSSSNCPDTPVPSGTYRIVGLWADHVAPQPDVSRPVSVTIQPSLL